MYDPNTVNHLSILIPVLDDPCERRACLRSVAGIVLVRRVMLMAEKAGFDHIVVVSSTENQAIEAALADSPARYMHRESLNLNVCDHAVLILAPDCLPDQSFFNSLSEISINPDDMLLWADGKAAMLGADRCGILRHCMQSARCFSQLIDGLSKLGKVQQIQGIRPQRVGLPVLNDEDRARAETMLLSGLVKATEGWMALHINRKISLSVTRRLMHTCVTPNHMTWVSMILGLMAAACFLSLEHGIQIIGALLFLLHSILDGCDGELARLKFMESRRGGIFDFWSDNIVHIAVFAAMGMAWAAHSPDSFWPWLCSTLAVGGTAVSASLIYFHTMHTEQKSGPLYTSVSTSEDKSTLVRIADILSRRDFIYLVFVLTLFNLTHWFLIMTAIGSPVYALLLVSIILCEPSSDDNFTFSCGRE